LPRCILPFISDTMIQITARLIKNILCEGRYDFRLAGFVHTIVRKDIARIMISAKRVIVLNLRFSIFLPSND